MRRALTAIETSLGLPKGFLLRVKDEDDWSMIIKCHALIEAAVSHLLTHSIGDVRLLPIFTRLELSNSATGKLAFTKSLNLLESHERAFVKCMSELRNQLVHNIENINIDLKSYFENLPTEKSMKWKNAVAHWGVSSNITSERLYNYSNFKGVLWHSTIIFVIKTISRIEKRR